MASILARALAAPLLLTCACSAQIVAGGGGSPTSSTGTGASTTSAIPPPPPPGTTVAGTGGAPGTTVASTSVVVGTGGAPGTTVAGTGGAGGAVACSPPQQAMIWAKMDQAPLAPPGQAALLDLAGQNKMGLTLPEAQSILCQGTDMGDAFGDGSGAYAWGDNQEVWLDYTLTTQLANFMVLWPGYAGTLLAKSRDGVHLFEIGLTTQIQKDGAPYQLDWNLPGALMSPQFVAEVNELNDALLATYLPGVMDADCTTSGDCTTGTFGDTGFVYFKKVGVALWVASVSAPQPTPSTPNRIDVYPGQ